MAAKSTGGKKTTTKAAKPATKAKRPAPKRKAGGTGAAPSSN